MKGAGSMWLYAIADTPQDGAGAGAGGVCNLDGNGGAEVGFASVCRARSRLGAIPEESRSYSCSRELRR